MTAPVFATSPLALGVNRLLKETPVRVTTQTGNGPFWLSAEILISVLAHTVSHSESFDGQSAIVCVRELVCREGGAGCSPTCTGPKVAVLALFECCGGLPRWPLPVSGCGEMREGLLPCPTTLCVWRNLRYLTLNRITARGRGVRRVVVTFQEREGMAHMHLRAFERVIKA